MGRVTAYIALAALIGVATGLVLHRVVLGMLVGGGILILELLILLSRLDSSHPEPSGQSSGSDLPGYCG